MRRDPTTGKQLLSFEDLVRNDPLSEAEIALARAMSIGFIDKPRVQAYLRSTMKSGRPGRYGWPTPRRRRR